jgi:hypothetical protein
MPATDFLPTMVALVEDWRSAEKKYLAFDGIDIWNEDDMRTLDRDDLFPSARACEIFEQVRTHGLRLIEPGERIIAACERRGYASGHGSPS